MSADPEAAASVRSEDELYAELGSLRQLYIEYDRLRRIKSSLHQLIKRDNKASEGGCMLLVGSSGSGKTKFIEDFTSEYPLLPHRLLGPLGDKADYATVVKAEVPDNTTKALAERLFKAFTRRAPPVRARRFDLLDAVLDHAQQMGTKLLILEEVSQSIDQKTDRVAAEVATLIKDLLNASIFSILLVGTLEAKRLVSHHPELARRVLRVWELGPFRWDNPDEQETYRKILDKYDDRLKDIIGVRSELSDPETALRILVATGCMVGTTAKFLEVAGSIAIDQVVENGKTPLTQRHLAQAFQEASLFKEEPNPFTVDDIGELLRPPEKDEVSVPVAKPKRRR